MSWRRMPPQQLADEPLSRSGSVVRARHDIDSRVYVSRVGGWYHHKHAVLGFDRLDPLATTANQFAYFGGGYSHSDLSETSSSWLAPDDNRLASVVKSHGGVVNARRRGGEHRLKITFVPQNETGPNVVSILKHLTPKRCHLFLGGQTRDKPASFRVNPLHPSWYAGDNGALTVAREEHVRSSYVRHSELVGERLTLGFGGVS
mmetsp:Transcript_8602/g.22208  ORF Transcript_8602/g.22208 Transcript_8602/m.22208 type:complete len:203 (-) Transcript_8602:1476-2084(-)